MHAATNEAIAGETDNGGLFISAPQTCEVEPGWKQQVDDLHAVVNGRKGVAGRAAGREPAVRQGTPGPHGALERRSRIHRANLLRGAPLDHVLVHLLEVVV